ncbi:FAD-binding domain-containing protein [Sphingomonas sp.]|uniref:FAD-binding domain-containing protein n=1 Tax=Sphingomonas sp. TaxID=28214 RepID=UPI0025E17B48|nr:FAD-binding domain-containing protein [Sphingomonas sp.]
MTIQLVWFKRDLRLIDHAALADAARCGPVLPLVIVEPDYWQLPDTSARQWQFWRGCIAELSTQIATQGGQLIIRSGKAIEVLDELRRAFGTFDLWSHEETGNGWTFARDRKVKAWTKANTIPWAERQQFGVHRERRLNRDHWAKRWNTMMQQPIASTPDIIWAEPVASDPLPTCDMLGLAPDGLVHLQQPGRAAGVALLHSFLSERGEHYTREMSSPVTAEQTCSRLSPHLAYGTLSVREVYQAAQQRAAQLARERPANHSIWGRSIRSFTARLHWHCHFIQKLEREPAIEWEPFAKIYIGMRPRPGDAAHLQAWSEGRTGYPFIDAAMRYLNAVGYINFRMRAMLMSFATYDLWLPWQEAGLVLARKFVDFEPGIHWSQCQMQSGETGINTVRVYSPIKQGHDQDPSGDFIRAWVPELAGVAGALVHEPWRIDVFANASPCPGYPLRIVDHKAATERAKNEIFSRRKSAEARAEAQGVYIKHGSRAGLRARRGAKARALEPKLAAPQFSLDL